MFILQKILRALFSCDTHPFEDCRRYGIQALKGTLEAITGSKYMDNLLNINKIEIQDRTRRKTCIWQ